MAVLSKVGSFLCPTSNGTQRIGGLGFRPRIVFFYLVNRSAEGSGPSDKLCLGFAAGRDAFDRG